MDDKEARKQMFAVIAQDYVKDVEFENLHRKNMIFNFVASMSWIILTIANVWGFANIGKDPIWVTWVGVMLLFTQSTMCYCVHMKHKKRVRELLQHRQLALQWKDGQLP